MVSQTHVDAGTMTAALTASLRPSLQRVRVLATALAVAAFLLASFLFWSWRGELGGRWQPLQIWAEQPAGVCAAAAARRAAAAEAAAVKAGAPPLQQVEADVVAQQCSDEFRAAAYQNGTTGLLGPPLMARGCPLEQVGVAEGYEVSLAFVSPHASSFQAVCQQMRMALSACTLSCNLICPATCCLSTQPPLGSPHLPACPPVQCNLFFVFSQLKMLRHHPRFDSLLRMVPCDLWRALRGRTLWLVGDSQAQV